MWSEDTAIGDVATMRSTADVFTRRAHTSRTLDERERYLQYAKLYRELAERIESGEAEADDQP
jgi:hypothetical protein